MVSLIRRITGQRRSRRRVQREALKAKGKAEEAGQRIQESGEYTLRALDQLQQETEENKKGIEQLEVRVGRLERDYEQLRPPLVAPEVSEIPSEVKPSPRVRTFKTPESSEEEKRREEVGDTEIVYTKEEAVRKDELRDHYIFPIVDSMMDQVHPDDRSDFSDRADKFRSQSSKAIDPGELIRFPLDMDRSYSKRFQEETIRKNELLRLRERKDDYLWFAHSLHGRMSPEVAKQFDDPVKELSDYSADVFPFDRCRDLIEKEISTLMEEQSRSGRHALAWEQKEHFLRAIRAQSDLVPEDRRAEFRQRADALESEPVDVYKPQPYLDLLLEEHRAAVLSERPVPAPAAPPQPSPTTLAGRIRQYVDRCSPVSLGLVGISLLLGVLGVAGVIGWAANAILVGWRSAYIGWLTPLFLVMALALALAAYLVEVVSRRTVVVA